MEISCVHSWMNDNVYTHTHTHIFNEMLFSNEKEIHHWRSVGGSWRHYAKWDKSYRESQMISLIVWNQNKVIIINHMNKGQINGWWLSEMGVDMGEMSDGGENMWNFQL